MTSQKILSFDLTAEKSYILSNYMILFELREFVKLNQFKVKIFNLKA